MAIFRFHTDYVNQLISNIIIALLHNHNLEVLAGDDVITAFGNGQKSKASFVNLNRRSFQFRINCEELITRKHNFSKIGFAVSAMMVSQVFRKL